MRIDDEATGSVDDNAVHLAGSRRFARIEQLDGAWVAVSDTPITDDNIFDVLDSIRR
jgi:hypothetical protein